MNIFIALSCLQGRPQQQAFDELRQISPDGVLFGVQLTPGNLPSRGFRQHLEQLERTGQANTRFHHGFCWSAMKRPVWSSTGEALVTGPKRSVHPPLPNQSIDRSRWFARLVERQAAVDSTERQDQSTDHQAERTQSRGDSGLSIETMYPGQWFGTGDELDEAMDCRIPLAVDISHIFIQRTAGVLADKTWQRLQEYELITEIHVSANSGHHDSHSVIAADTFGLAWARSASLQRAIPLVYESYLHRLSAYERSKQIALVLPT